MTGRAADTGQGDDRLRRVLDDLAVDSTFLEGLVAELDDAGWRRPTPAAGWDVATTVAHLAWTDEVAVLAATDKAGWDAVVLEAIADPDGFVDARALEGGRTEPALLLQRWRTGRTRLAEVLAQHPAHEKLPWFGPPMSPTSMTTARYMETWAHGLDIADALGVKRAPTARLRHIARLAARTRDFAYGVRGETPPAEEFRIEVTSPDGDLWVFGPEDAAQRVTGPAADLCLLAAQRVHRSDTTLVAEGPDADHWLDIAQMFAGPPGEGRAPGGPA